MIADQVREFMEEAPFKPFKLHLADGKTVEIDHPDFLAYTRDYQMVIVAMPNGACRAINLANITQIEGHLSEHG